jgi:hypothetical protein
VEFTDGGNWTTGAPNGVDATANFLGVTSASTTVLSMCD